MVEKIRDWLFSNLIFSVLSGLVVIFVKLIISQLIQQGERWHWKYFKIGSLDIPYFPWLHPQQGVEEEYIGNFYIAGGVDVLAIALIPKVYRLKENRKKKRSNSPLRFLYPDEYQQKSIFANPIAIYPFAFPPLQHDGNDGIGRRTVGELYNDRKSAENFNKTNDELMIDLLRQDRLWQRWIISKDYREKFKFLIRSPHVTWSSRIKEKLQPIDIPEQIQCTYLLEKESQRFKKGKEAILSKPIGVDKPGSISE